MIHTTGLTLRVAGRTLLADLDWQVTAGQCWSVIGRNGAGKSTLLRTLAGLRPADGGSITIGGRPLASWQPMELARQRAFLPQSRSDTFSYSVLETVLTARHPYHAERYWESDDDHRIAHQALQALQVAELAARDVCSLSGGERQRVAIAAMLAQDTPLLLLDEPANALDLAHQISVMGLLARLCRQQQRTAIMVGHDLNLAHSASTHVLLLMGDGAWLAGPVATVMQPAILSDYLGHPIEMLQHNGRSIFIPKEGVA